MRIRRAAWAAVLSAAVAVCATAAATPSPAAGIGPAASAGASYRDPVAGYSWGINTGSQNPLWPTYEHASGSTRALLGRIALQPRTRWYSSYIPTSSIASKIRTDVVQEQHGNPRVQVWMALFRLWPHQESAYRTPMSAADITAYRAWMRSAARAIGSTRAAIVLEPDLPVAVQGWRPAVRLGLVRWAAQLLGALPNATVYLDAGASDWLSSREAATLLRTAGIAYVHGFALGITHHTSVAAEVRYGGAVAAALGKAGIAGKHFVVDTSDNGRPYTNAQFTAAHPGRNTNDPVACSTRVRRACVALGIPPTTRVADPGWRLPAPVRAVARRQVDAFMWIGQPWMSDNTRQFSLPFVEDIVRASPYR